MFDGKWGRGPGGEELPAARGRPEDVLTHQPALEAPGGRTRIRLGGVPAAVGGAGGQRSSASLIQEAPKRKARLEKTLKRKKKLASSSVPGGDARGRS